MTQLDWKRGPLGWSAYANGQRFSIRPYRRGNGKGLAYVLRVNESALTSPAQATTLKEAKAAAQQAATQVADTEAQP